MMTIRTQRMIDAAPWYYQNSRIFEAIQAAQGDEYDSLYNKIQDLRKQYRISTATWGLKYWESICNIPVNEEDSYDIRRSRVLARWRSIGNFSAALVQNICNGYLNGASTVTVNIPGLIINIVFTSNEGIPPNLNDLKMAIDDVVHAHINVGYIFKFHIWEAIDQASISWANQDVLNQTWDNFDSIS
jgi:hypothetical protein